MLTHIVEVQTWLEELVQEQYYTGTRRYSLSGLKAGNNGAKLCVRFGRFIVDFSRSVNSFGLASFVAQGIITLLHWVATGPSRKSIGERTR